MTDRLRLSAPGASPVIQDVGIFKESLFNERAQLSCLRRRGNQGGTAGGKSEIVLSSLIRDESFYFKIQR